MTPTSPRMRLWLLAMLSALLLSSAFGLAESASARKLFCASNDDCPGKKVCDPVAHQCRKACDVECRKPDPVCGSDGVTYECGRRDARCHGAGVEHEGPCAPPACREDLDCPAGELCAEGRCEGCACIQVYDPVCGVDGRTYGNACSAHCAHVEVAHPGECGGTPCTANAECTEGTVCREGSCQEPCEIQCLVYDPVCGSDGVTYACGAADAACHGVTVVHPGECPAFCGGIAGFPCPEGQRCVDDPADDCDPEQGGADCGGICVPDPREVGSPREKLRRWLDALQIGLRRSLASPWSGS